jgi:hypothetical protein
MTLPVRIRLTVLLTPVFWFAYLWSLYLTPKAVTLPLPIATLLILGISIVSAYCITHFALLIKNTSPTTTTTVPMPQIIEINAQTDQ